jgi:lysophospholipase L1-like esterase
MPRPADSDRGIWSRPIAVSAGIVLAGIMVWLFVGRGPEPARPTAGERIVAFGDSLVQGVGASPGRDMVSILSRRLGVPIVNAGRSGDTTGTALTRLDAAVLSRNPRVVVVLLGGNDMLRRLPRDRMFENLETIVTRIRSRGAAVILVTVEIGFGTGADGPAFEALAERTSSALVRDILGGIFGRQALMSDGIHPNNSGYEIMADRIEPVLRRLVESR